MWIWERRTTTDNYFITMRWMEELFSRMVWGFFLLVIRHKFLLSTAQFLGSTWHNLVDFLETTRIWFSPLFSRVIYNPEILFLGVIHSNIQQVWLHFAFISKSVRNCHLQRIWYDFLVGKELLYLIQVIYIYILETDTVTLPTKKFWQLTYYQ